MSSPKPLSVSPDKNWLSDAAYAQLGAAHGYLARPDKRESFAQGGVLGAQDAIDLILEIRQAPDTKCFLAGRDRELYANDRLNAVHISNGRNPEKSTVFINDLEGLASTRLERYAISERIDEGVPAIIRTGGAAALEVDRIAARHRASKAQPAITTAPTSAATIGRPK